MHTGSEPANKRFLVKLVAFFAPIGLYLLLTVALPLLAGEYKAIEEVATAQSGAERVLYGPAYRDNYYAFKLASTRTRRPEILVLGSSRSMQFRAELFSRHPDRFYNAGGAVQHCFELREFLKDLESAALPRLLILGLDQPWFNARTAPPYSRRRIQQQVEHEHEPGANRAMNVSRFVFWDFLQGKIPIGRLLDRREPLYGDAALGIAAAVRGSGFRNDGSYQYSMILQPEPAAARLAEGYQRLRDNAGHFVTGDAVSATSLDEIQALLDFCRERGVDVLAFSPPYAPSLYRKMAEGGQHPYLAASAAQLKATFERQGFGYFDFTDAAAVGAEDDDMLDGFHGSEFVSLRMYQVMLAAEPERLGPYSDAAFLAERASAPRVDRLVVFDRP